MAATGATRNAMMKGHKYPPFAGDELVSHARVIGLKRNRLVAATIGTRIAQTCESPSLDP
jgi:hypothetical protein